VKAHGGSTWLDRRPAARLAKDCIKKVEVLEYPELGMEGVEDRLVDFPAFIVATTRQRLLFAGLTGGAVKLKTDLVAGRAGSRRIGVSRAARRSRGALESGRRGRAPRG